MIESLLLGKPQPVRIGPNLELDCVLREVHGMQSEVTRLPVEEGADISDNWVNEPEELIVEGVITNSPVRILGTFFTKQTRGTVQNQKVTGVGVNLVQLAFEELQRIHQAKKLITITTRLKTYTDMAMVSAPVPRLPEHGDGIQFSATFRKIRKVSIKTTDIQVIRTKRESAQPVRRKGKQNTTPAGRAAEAKVSIAEQGLRGIISSFGGGG
jgi:hypothetical protein